MPFVILLSFSFYTFAALKYPNGFELIYNCIWYKETFFKWQIFIQLKLKNLTP